MSTGLLVFFIASMALFICYYLVIVQNRKQSQMCLMMTAMAGGMTAGVLFGTIMGLLLRGDFVQSTILGIVVGMTIGAFIGLPHQLITTIEGMLAGLMGGMMGAMIGEMSPIGQEDTLLKFLFMISLIILLIIVRLFHGESPSIVVTFLRNPLIAFLIVLFVFLGLERIDTFFPEERIDTENHHVSTLIDNSSLLYDSSDKK
ncbi:hypothetical protein JCM9140_426 [Halalkalibacter wakoensis JCM 9140]|uniref:Uncharacterized protein n=1 Tax=Halalkalibacter wakoensis JCM 9140 TaxID=1236970 RepID=W4PYF4_9BACI|nr:hypothetical protein [Halalkalibacter wakoensis]GAE24493.1 hypothetical protein JCM9140_426 [Halalkalibacter wakoensis JCM 9140]